MKVKDVATKVVMVVASEIENLAYGVLSVEQTVEVVDIYIKHQSVELASEMLSFPYAPASVARLVRWAVGVGLMEEADKQPVGGRANMLEAAQAAWSRHPDAGVADIARLVGCGEMTSRRAKPGKNE